MLTAGEKKSSIFGFACGRYDAENDRRECRNSAVDASGLISAPHEENTTDDGPSHRS